MVDTSAIDDSDRAEKEDAAGKREKEEILKNTSRHAFGNLTFLPALVLAHMIATSFSCAEPLLMLIGDACHLVVHEIRVWYVNQVARNTRVLRASSETR